MKTKLIKTSVQLDQGIIDWLDEQAKENQTNRSEVLRYALQFMKDNYVCKGIEKSYLWQNGNHK